MNTSKDCTVIKTKELNDLHNKISKLESEISDLKYNHKKEIRNLKEAHAKEVKPDSLDIEIHNQPESCTYMSYYGRQRHEAKLRWFTPTTVKFRSTINFSSGISGQLYRIGKLIKEAMKAQHKSEMDSVLEQAEKSRKEEKILVYNDIKEFVKSQRILTKRNLNDKINEKINDLNGELNESRY